MRHLFIMLIAAAVTGGCSDNFAFGPGGGGAGGAGDGGGPDNTGGAPGGSTSEGGGPDGGGGQGGSAGNCPVGDTLCDNGTLLTCDGVSYTDPVDCVDVGLEQCIAGACEIDLKLRLGFDEGGGSFTLDDAQGFQGQLLDAGWTAGHDGNAVLFGGTGHVELGDVLNELSLPFTLSAWVYVPFGVLDNATIIATDGAPPYQGAYLRVDPELGSTVVVGYGNAAGMGPAQRHAKRSTLTVPFEQWVHVAGVFRMPDDASIYIDGVEAGGTYSGGAQFVAHTTDPFVLGRDIEGIAGLIGAIDEARVYSRALPAADVLVLAGSSPM